MRLPSDLLNVIIGLGVLVGAIQCFFGYRIFKIILGLIGFITGGALAGAIGYGISGEEGVAFLSAIVGGAIGAALLIALYFIGVFLIGAFLGGLMGVILFGVSNTSPEPAVLLILALIGGVIALIFQKFMIILSTSFGGSWSMVTGIAYFTIRGFDPTNLKYFLRSGGTQLYAIILCWLALGIFGLIVQYRFLPKPSEKEITTEKKEHIDSAQQAATPDRYSAGAP